MKSLHSFLSFLLLLLIAGNSLATNVSGVVKRKAAEPAPTRGVDRYRGRSSATPNHENGGSTCACNPGLYSVVWLTGDSLPPIMQPDVMPSMAQKDMMFQPPVLAVGVGTTVTFPNRDPFFHNVFSYSKQRKFDLGRYPEGETAEVTFDKPGVIKVFCEIHYSMRAYIHVLPTPYCATSDDRGKFSLPNVRPGKYELHVWQENQSEITQPLVVGTDPVHLEIE
jgi:plastocyanin